MNKDLNFYFRLYKEMIPTDQCFTIVNELDKKNWDDHKFYSHGNLVDNGNEPKEYHGEIPSIAVIQQAIWNSLKQYILEDTNFPWFTGWQGFSVPKFIKYNKNQEMHNHCDHIHNIYDGIHKGIPILSVIGLLNNDFKGGDFILFDDTKIELNVGDIIVFPSIFLFPHKVTKITSGCRYSFASWSN